MHFGMCLSSDVEAECIVRTTGEISAVYRPMRLW